jgi:hypothetical protein
MMIRMIVTSNPMIPTPSTSVQCPFCRVAHRAVPIARPSDNARRDIAAAPAFRVRA